MNFEQDMHIDESALDMELLEQATLALKYGKYWAECKERLTRAEENIKVIRSELIRKANSDPDRYLGQDVKPTAPNIEAFYRNHPNHKEAKEEWIEAQYELNMAEVAKNEISFTRKTALENLVKLHGQGYIAGPQIPHNLSQLREERRNQLHHRIGQSLKRKPKQ